MAVVSPDSAGDRPWLSLQQYARQQYRDADIVRNQQCFRRHRVARA
jgi:hypothetical protein